MRKVIVLISFIISQTSFGQLPDIINHKHKNKIERISSARKKLKKYKKFYSKDSLKNLKAISKSWDIKMDSLSTLGLDTSRVRNSTALHAYTDQFSPEQINDLKKYRRLEKEFEIDSSAYLHRKDSLGDLSYADFYKEEKRLYLKENGYDADSVSQVLSELKGDYAKDSFDNYARKYRDQQIAGRKELYENEGRAYGQEFIDNTTGSSSQAWSGNQPKLNGYNTQMKQYSNTDSIKGAGIAKGKSFLLANPAMIEKAKHKTKLLKQQYTSIPNSNDLSTAQKANSLKGKSLSNRLWLGGNFQWDNVEPYGFFFDPAIGYKINKKWLAGVGVKFQFTLGKYDTLNQSYNKRESTFGYKTFVNYNLLKGFYFSTEFENNRVLLTSNDVESTQWVQGFLIGAGKSFHVVGAVKAMVSLHYNFLHDPARSQYGNPLIFRFGFALPSLSSILKKK